MFYNFSWMRGIISTLLIVSLVDASIAPSFAVRDVDARASVARRHQSALDHSARLTKRLGHFKRSHEQQLSQKVFRSTPATNIIFSQITQSDRNQARLVSRGWRGAVRIAERDSVTFHANLETLVSFPLIPLRFAHIVVDGRNLERGRLQNTSWNVSAERVPTINWNVQSVDVMVKDHKALEALLRSTTSKTKLHVEMEKYVTTDTILEWKASKPLAAPRKKMVPAPVHYERVESWREYQNRLKAWGEKRLKKNNLQQSPPYQRSYKDLSSLAVSVDKIETALNLLRELVTDLDLNNKWRGEYPLKKIIVFMNAYIEDFKYFDNAGNAIWVTSSASVDHRAQLLQLRNQLGPRLQFYTLNDVYKDCRGQLVPWLSPSDPSPAGLISVLPPIGSNFDTKKLLMSLYVSLGLRPSTLQELVTQAAKCWVPSMKGYHFYNLVKALHSIPSHQRDHFVDCLKTLHRSPSGGFRVSAVDVEDLYSNWLPILAEAEAPRREVITQHLKTFYQSGNKLKELYSLYCLGYHITRYSAVESGGETIRRGINGHPYMDLSDEGSVAAARCLFLVPTIASVFFILYLCNVYFSAPGVCPAVNFDIPNTCSLDEESFWKEGEFVLKSFGGFR